MFSDIPLSIILLPKAIIRYFSYPQGYKHYCQKITDNIPLAPDLCPFCLGNDCLIGHGWYTRKELVSGYTKLYGSFKIYRYLCKSTGSTVSMHPDFSHSYKRYLLHVVIFILCSHDLEGKSWYRISLETGICIRTLLHWHKGFSRDEHIKKICFFPKSHSPPEEKISVKLLRTFVSDNPENAGTLAAHAMIRLAHEYHCRLY